jgi:hypothetical protein
VRSVATAHGPWAGAPVPWVTLDRSRAMAATRAFAGSAAAMRLTGHRPLPEALAWTEGRRSLTGSTLRGTALGGSTLGGSTLGRSALRRPLDMTLERPLGRAMHRTRLATTERGAATDRGGTTTDAPTLGPRRAEASAQDRLGTDRAIGLEARDDFLRDR